MLRENACHHGVKLHMLSDNVAVLLKVARTRECSKGLCKAKEKEKTNGVKAALPLTLFKWCTSTLSTINYTIIQ